MKNIEFQIKDEIMTLRIDLKKEFGPSKTGASQIIASSQGNVLLFDTNGFRDERLNLSLTRKIEEV